MRTTVAVGYLVRVQAVHMGRQQMQLTAHSPYRGVNVLPGPAVSSGNALSQLDSARQVSSSHVELSTITTSTKR